MYVCIECKTKICTYNFFNYRSGTKNKKRKANELWLSSKRKKAFTIIQNPKQKLLLKGVKLGSKKKENNNNKLKQKFKTH